MNADLLIIKSMDLQDSKMEEFFDVVSKNFEQFKIEFEDIKKHVPINPEIIRVYENASINGIQEYFEEYLGSNTLEQKADILTTISCLIHRLREGLKEIIY